MDTIIEITVIMHITDIYMDYNAFNNIYLI